MAETTISRADAAALRSRILRAVDEIERAGFDRQMICAAMIGVAGGIVAVHSGRTELRRCLDAVRDAEAASSAN